MPTIKLRVEKTGRYAGVIMSVLRLIFCFFLFSGAATGNPSARATVDFVAEVGEARLMLAEHILRSAADFVASNPDIGSVQGHRALARILNKAPPFRSILAIDNEGQLRFDSFNMVKFLGASDLSRRAYFSSTTNAASKQMIVNSPIVAKQSGRVTIPLTMAVPNGNGRFQEVVALMADPEALLPKVETCGFCGVLLAKGGEVLVSNHFMSEINEAIVARLEFTGHYGMVELTVRGMDVSVHWKRSASTDLVFVFYEATPIKM
ncbi:hypothetical protein [Thalassovita sp.]|jgi:hypothetical protein|uniref:PDC sensor domain-containing protein n=1 Tax=Thalassovita sp. TaxID=1979401 RepID=UPI002AB27DB9|nr:hypothetical protein [Thalassovita sp.]